MASEIQFIFFALACLCFFWETFFERRRPARFGLVALGWLFFCIPFAYNAASSAAW